MAVRIIATLLTFATALSSSDRALNMPSPEAGLQLGKQGFLGTSATSDVGASYGHPSWLSSCRHIFLDVGSNRGVQVRKFFEPHKYPKAKLPKEFDAAFGAPPLRTAPAESSGLCVLGLEPNPEHMERLKAIESAYEGRGW